MRSYEYMDDTTAQEYLDRYVASLPELRARFARRLEVTRGPSVDLSVEALRDLDPWYAEQIVDPTPDGLTGTPLWWDDSYALQPGDQRLRLVDEVGAHLAAVLQDAVPMATWLVCKQPGGSRTFGHHATVLEVGTAMVEPWSIAYKHVASLLRDEPLRAGVLHHGVAYFVEKAATADG